MLWVLKPDDTYMGGVSNCSSLPGREESLPSLPEERHPPPFDQSQEVVRGYMESTWEGVVWVVACSGQRRRLQPPTASAACLGFFFGFFDPSAPCVVALGASIAT